MRRSLLAVVLIMGLVAVWPTPSSIADVATAPFSASGTVTDESEPIDPTPVEGENGAFVLGAGFQGSDSATRFARADGSLKIHVTPSTFYFRKEASGQYRRSTRAEVVVEGEAVRASGRRVTNSQGHARFIARAVWNPPNDPAPPGGQPPCLQEQGLKNAAFNIKATIVSLQVHYPCTPFGAYKGGMKVSNFTETPTPGVARGIEAYDGTVEIYLTFATRYIKNGQASSYGQVVQRGNEVRVLGRFQYANGAWLFVARTVYTPAGQRGDTFNPDTTVQAIQTGPGEGNTLHYEGPSDGPSFKPPDGRFQADVVWTPVGLDYTVAGTWSLSTGNDILRGTLDGQTEGSSLEMSMEVTGGQGFWSGSTGAGDFEGDVVQGLPGTPPAAFNGVVRLSIVRSR